MVPQTIVPDKLNMLRHIDFFGNMAGVKAHMKKHAAILWPKFALVLDKLAQGIGGLGIGTWITPKGGYFISFEAMPGCAKAIVALCKGAGVTMTDAGATYPYRLDPNDSNIRIAPSFPTADELGQAMDLFVLCVKLASVRKLLADG
jgi:DNA-binding transcriptional MocR family regulator